MAGVATLGLKVPNEQRDMLKAPDVSPVASVLVLAIRSSWDTIADETDEHGRLPESAEQR
jgi:hypothetical protein